MKKDMQSVKSTWVSTKYMLSIVWGKMNGKKYITLSALRSLILAAFPVIYTVFPGFIINEIMNGKITNKLIIYVGILVLAPVLDSAINILTGRYLKRVSLNFDTQLETLFYQHTMSMDYENLENPELQELKGRAGETISEALSIVDKVFSLIYNIITFLSISTIIFSLNPILIIIICIFMYINSKATKWLNAENYKNWEIFTKLSRYKWGYSYMLDNFHYAKELRLFNFKDYILNKFTANEEKINDVHFKDHVNQSKVSFLASATNFIQDIAVYCYLIYCVIYRGLSVGTMTIYISSIEKFKGALSAIVNSYLALTGSSLKIQEFIKFMEIPLVQYTTGDKIPFFDKDSVIEFKNVSFKYPGSDRFVIKNLNITLRGDEKLCIVGQNGAGKSTFIKLLVRLYFPTEGEILLNNVNINEYDYEKYQRLFAPVFQDFCTYTLTLKENIILSDEYDSEKFKKVTGDSGIDGLIGKLPKGIDTQVDKWIDEEGFEPSGGEGQRIAIARACYHNGEIFMLDEPTAALDPMAEYEIYTQFSNMITDKCAVLITHRLSAVQLADKVAVFDDGRVAEYGTHAELYAKGGIYTEMFDKQAQFYRDEPKSDN